MSACSDDLGACSNDLGACSNDMGACSDDLGACSNDLGACSKSTRTYEYMLKEYYIELFIHNFKINKMVYSKLV